MEVKERILLASKELFNRFGIRGVKMDDVAKEVSMSKKTLYQYFKDKDQLVDEATKAHLEIERLEFDSIYKNASNAIEELYMVSKCLRRNMNEVNPNLLHDLKRFYPVSWQHWLEFKEQHVYKSIVDNLNAGKQTGHYRQNLDTQVVARLRMVEVEMLFDIHTFPPAEFDFRQVQMQLFDHFVFGIATEDGRKLYQQYLESEKNEAVI